MPEAKKTAILKAILKNPRILKAKLSLNVFLYQYMRKFRIQDVAGNLIIHSHLPPLNSRAYGRFVDEHLLGRTEGPSHAQLGLTNACPQHCAYCYNRDRKGTPLDKATILGVIGDLKRMGVFWLGFTGGEPLLNKNIVEITERASDGCAVKLFTTGCTLTKELAADLKKAGLFSVSVSLDHWRKEDHDRVRGYAGAYEAALKAIEILKNVGGLHVGVSAVLSKEMIARDQAEELLKFLISLGVDEAWLSETKPSVAAFWNESHVITEEDRQKLVNFQDRFNKEGKITVNYLGHFEGREHFGCNAGNKMVYIDAFGEVSPCVFTPLTFGNVQEQPFQDIYREMKQRFCSQDHCFVNSSFRLFQKYFRGDAPIPYEDTLRLMQEVQFGPLAKFFKLYDS